MLGRVGGGEVGALSVGNAKGKGVSARPYVEPGEQRLARQARRRFP